MKIYVRYLLEWLYKHKDSDNAVKMIYFIALVFIIQYVVRILTRVPNFKIKDKTV